MRHSGRRLGLVAACVLGIWVVSGCGGDGQDEATATSSPSQGEATAAASESPGTGTPAGDATTVASPSTPAASGGGSSGDGLATATLTITGGARAGEYTATIVEGGCSRGTFGPNTFAVASSRADSTGGFDGPQLTIFDASAAGGGTDQFGVGLPFDAFADNLLMSPKEGRGSGTVTLDDRGDSATIHAQGTLETGDGADLTVECHAVTALG